MGALMLMVSVAASGRAGGITKYNIRVHNLLLRTAYKISILYFEYTGAHFVLCMHVSLKDWEWACYVTLIRNGSGRASVYDWKARNKWIALKIWNVAWRACWPGNEAIIFFNCLRPLAVAKLRKVWIYLTIHASLQWTTTMTIQIMCTAQDTTNAKINSAAFNFQPIWSSFPWISDVVGAMTEAVAIV